MRSHLPTISGGLALVDIAVLASALAWADGDGLPAHWLGALLTLGAVTTLGWLIPTAVAEHVLASYGRGVNDTLSGGVTPLNLRDKR